MSSINYLNPFFEEITSNQALQSSEYILQKSESDVVKAQEFYTDGVLSSITYFLDNTETESQIIQQYPNLMITFYKNEIVSGIYKKYDVEVVDSNGILINKYVEVFGESIYPIYYKAIDVQTNNMVFFKKSYYDAENEMTYDFEYDQSTGNFLKLTVLDPHNYYDTEVSTILPSGIGVGNNPFDFSWTGFEYYQNALPIIPV